MMLGVNVTQNSVSVPTIQTACCKSEFDSTYPIHLNGIIHPDEYRESIANINRVTQSSTSLMISGLITALCIIGGMVLFIAGGMTAVMSRKSGFPVLVGIGIGLFLFGMIFFVVAFFNIHSKRSFQLHRAIAQESVKYSNRSPIPCSWRLNVTRIFTGGFHRQRHARLIYHLVIEFGSAVPTGYANGPFQFNQVVPRPSAFPTQPDAIAAPPSYSQAIGGYCTQCGTAKQNPSARFCPQCGQSFNKY